MIKVTYNTIGKGMTRPEQTKINITYGKMFVQYSIPNKAKTVVDQMKKDGRTGVMFSRGMMIQFFSGKNEEEILEIVKVDINNGLYVAEEQKKVKFEIQDLVIKRE